MARETRETRERHEMGRSRFLIHLFASFACFAGLLSVRADEPFFKKGDVIALVGGEDMVALSEYGYLELLLTRALPEHRLKFRNLAWEGDTVFEQRRDLNFPTWEQALDQIGATVVICQFGQMESLAGKEKLPEFVAAYEKLIGRFTGGGKRRVILLSPGELEAMTPSDWLFIQARQSIRDDYVQSIRKLASQSEGRMEISPANQPRLTRKTNPRSETALDGSVFPTPVEGKNPLNLYTGVDLVPRGGFRSTEDMSARTRDGLHANYYGHLLIAEAIGWKTSDVIPLAVLGRDAANHEALTPRHIESFRQLIIAKNRLWFDYWRVQNWAFLAGDRTEQPSSRDHLDRTKRWFPEERERFLPLIEKKEQEIADLAAKLAKGSDSK